MKNYLLYKRKKVFQQAGSLVVQTNSSSSKNHRMQNDLKKKKKDEINMGYICTQVLPHQLHPRKVLPNVKIYSECQRSTSNSTLPPTLCYSHSINTFLQREDTYQQWRYAMFYPGTTSATLGLK